MTARDCRNHYPGNIPLSNLRIYKYFKHFPQFRARFLFPRAGRFPRSALKLQKGQKTATLVTYPYQTLESNLEHFMLPASPSKRFKAKKNFFKKKNKCLSWLPYLLPKHNT